MNLNLDLLKNAIKYVRDLGKEDGNEHLAAVDAKGNILFCTHGERNSVSAEGYDFTNVSFIVHNHPSGSSLSSQDILMANYHKGTVVAVSPTGSIFASKGINLEVVRTSLENGATAEEVRVALAATAGLEQMEQVIADEMSLRSVFGQFRDDDYGVPISHMGNVIFHAQGLMDYEYSLSPEDRALYERYNSFFMNRSGLHNVRLT